MIEAALQKRFDILGFSSHSLYPHSSDWHMNVEEHQNYFERIRALKKEYEGRIKIFAGLEADYLPDISSNFEWQFKPFAPDYLIGSVHYLTNKNGFFTVDDSSQNVKEGLFRLYENNGKKAVCEYFDRQRQMLKSQKFLILGHPDVIRKRNGELRFFDEGESWYKKELKATAKEAARAGVVVEINTGGLSRKAIDDVYPSAEFLECFFNEGVPVTFSSDAHAAENLDFAFDRAELAAIRAGYTEAAYFDDGSIKFYELTGRLKF